MTEEAGCLKGLLEYSTDLFEAATIDLLLRSFEALLAGIVANPDAELGALPLLHESERRQLLEWSATKVIPCNGWIGESNKCLHHLFEEHVPA